MLKNLSIYTLTSLLNSGIPFLLLPILTLYLQPEEFGKLALFQVILMFCLPFVNVNIHGAINVSYFQLDKERFSQYVSSAILILCISFFIVMSLFYFFSNLVYEKLNFPPFWLLLIPVFALLQSIYMITLTIYQAQEKAFKYAKFLIGNTIVNFSVSLIFIVYLGLSWEGRLLGIMIATLMSSLLGILIINNMRYFTVKSFLPHIKDILHFGLPLLPHAIGGTLLAMSDRFFISALVNQEALGLYAVAFQVASIVFVFVASINKAWAPYLFKHLADGVSKKEELVIYSYYLFLGIFFSVFVLWVITPFIFDYLIDEKYAEALPYVLWLSIGFGLNGMYFIVVNYITYVKKTYYLAFLTISNGLLALVINYYLISNLGVMGAAYSAVINWFLFFVCAWILSNRIYPMPWLSALYKWRRA